jgi:hypothetical protein
LSTPDKSASLYECGRFTCTIKQHLGQMPPKHVAGLSTRVVNDKGRSHQQSQAPFLRGIKSHADTSHSRRASEITDILEAVVAGKVREIAIAREVGDSVLYRVRSQDCR